MKDGRRCDMWVSLYWNLYLKTHSFNRKQEMGEERAVSLKRGGGVGRRDNFIKHSIWQDHEIRNAQPSAWLIYTLPSTDCLIACLPTSISLIHPLKVSPTVHFVPCQGKAEHQVWHICQLFHREESNCQSYLCPSQRFNHRISTFLQSVFFDVLWDSK